jgi:hypothetical protein
MSGTTTLASEQRGHESVHVTVESAPGAVLRVERIELSKADLQSLTTDIVSIGTAKTANLSSEEPELAVCNS